MVVPAKCIGTTLNSMSFMQELTIGMSDPEHVYVLRADAVN